MGNTFLISFGNSKKYRIVVPEGECPDIIDPEERVRAFIEKKFPMAHGKSFLSTSTIEPIKDDELSLYEDYPLFVEDNIMDFIRSANRQAEVDEDVHYNNSNAPWGEF
ncbi:MAG: hypothetical protein NC204_02355 [Candidatus Amulumruptor caecigallinarius]|nr:hypothetical protein [Candidatus Amulumruptor caecigallinarius]